MAYDAFVDAKAIKEEGVSVSTGPDTGAAQILAYFAASPLIAAALVIVAGDRESAAIAAYFMGVYGAALIVGLPALLGATLPLAMALPLFAPIGGLYWKFPVIMIVVALLLIDDLKATHRGSGAPHWYLAVRLPLTVLIELAFVIAIVGGVR